AGAAKIRILFDDNRFQPQLAGANRRNISSGTAPDNRHIILCHAESPFGWDPFLGPELPPRPLCTRISLRFWDCCPVTRSFWRLLCPAATTRARRRRRNKLQILSAAVRCSK